MEPIQYSAPPSRPKTVRSLLTPLLIVAALAIALGIGFIWAFSQYLSYKNDAAAKIAAAVSEAETKKATELEAGFQAERDRLFNKYTTDPVIANVTLRYPRDWSFYLEQDTSDNEQINAIFNPTVVTKGNPGTYGLRLQIVQDLYSDVINDYQNEIERGEVSATPLTIGGTNGLRLEGQIDSHHTGALVAFPIRDKTLIIRTDSRDFISVFNDAVGKLIFTP